MSWWKRSLDLLYPPRCRGCGELVDDAWRFCPRCLGEMQPPASPLCSICGEPFAGAGPDHLCSRCLTRPPAFAIARACATYVTGSADGGVLKRTLHQYKYTPDVSLAPVFTNLLAEQFTQLGPITATAYDVVVPVPLHISRLRWRGFNQAQLLARDLARRRGLLTDPFAIERVRATDPQVELDERARRRNVAGAFFVPQASRVRGRRILLLDDVYTTGATVNECSRTLLCAGATQVNVLVLARALRH